MAIKIDLRVPPCGPANEVSDFVKQCEDVGFDGVGMLDSQLLERDIFVSMAIAAQATERIRISAAVLNPVTRHISVTASAAKTVAELAPGRIEFWIGRGFSSVQTIGVPPASVRQMRRSVLDLKTILSGEDMSYNGAVSRMRHGDGDAPPIYIAATGPRITEVAGEVADGVLLQVGIHPKAVEIARERLNEGAKRAGRDLNDLKIIQCATTVIHEDQNEARELVRPMCVQRIIEGSHNEYLQAAGIDIGELDIPEELNELYPDVIHAEDWERAKELCSFLPTDLLAQMCDVIGLIGTPEYCAQRVLQAQADGIDHLYLMTSATYDYPHRELAAFKETIFPALAAAG